MNKSLNLYQEKKKLTNRTSEMKRTRRDRREMEEVMFNLFERQSNWTLRLLIQETDQPEVSRWKIQTFCLVLDWANSKKKQENEYEKPEFVLLMEMWIWCSNSWKTCWEIFAYTTTKGATKELMSWSLSTRKPHRNRFGQKGFQVLFWII